MNKILKNKIVIFSAIAISFLAYFVISANFAEAQQLKLPGIGPTGTGLGAAAKNIGTAAGLSALKAGTWAVSILGFLVFLQHALWWFIGFGYSLLNSAVNVALDPNWFRIDAVLEGWRLVRDFVNVWFILVFLIIAIGTILRTSSYQAKKLLPTLILMALIVNFSMPISKFIIDVSNIISFQFLQAICPEVKNETGAQYCDFASNLENGLDAKGFTQAIKESVEISPTTEETTPKKNPKIPFNYKNELIPKAHAFAIIPILVIAAKWIGPAVAFLAFESIASYFTSTSFGGVSVGAFVNVLTTNIFLLFTAFVILAIAVLFLIRIISLIFLVIISPFGFAAMILPATQKYAEDWWNYLFKQSFFAPFVLFFLWMSLNLINNMKSAFTINGVPYDFTNPANARLMFYIFSIILLYASLWIARKMGAIGAETIIKWGNTARGAITGFVGGLAARSLVAPIGGAITAAGVPEAIGKRRWLGGSAAGVKAKDFAEWLSKRGKAPEKALEKAELGMRLAPADRAAYFAKLDRAAKEAMLRKMKGEERESLIAGLSGGEAEAARQILRSAAFKPEERARAEAERIERLPLAEQAKEFIKLSENEQQEYLLGIKDDAKRAEFISAVETTKGGLAAAQSARTFLKTSPRFTAEQRTKMEVEDFQRKYQGLDQQKQFGLLSQEAQRDFLMRFTDDGRRAEFIANVADPTNGNNPDAAKNAREFLETGARFTAGERFEHTKARMKQEMIQPERENRLDEFLESITDIKTQETYFKAMDDRQRLALLEEWYKDPASLAKFRGWALDMKPEDQDKFYRDTLGKRATPESVVAFINAISTGDPAKDLATKKTILSGASPQQLGRVAYASPALEPLTDQMARDTMSQQNFNLYMKNKKPPPRGGPTGGTPVTAAPKPVAPAAPAAPAAPTATIPIAAPEQLPPPPLITPTTPRIVTLNAEVERINELDPKINADAIKKAIDDLSKEPQFERLRRRINILIDYEFIEPGPKDTFKQIEFLQKTIAERSPTELHYKIDAKTLANPNVYDAVMRKANREQLTRLTVDEERAKIIRERLNNPKMFSLTATPTIVERVIRERGGTEFSAQNIIVKDPQLYSEAIEEIFETQYKNKELGKMLGNIVKTPDGQLDQPDQILKKRLFK